MVAPLKQQLHELVDRLGDQDVAETLEYVRWLIDDGSLPVTTETAPIDDEEESEDERVAVARALAQLECGDVVPHAQVRRDLGL